MGGDVNKVIIFNFTRIQYHVDDRYSCVLFRFLTFQSMSIMLLILIIYKIIQTHVYSRQRNYYLFY